MTDDFPADDLPSDVRSVLAQLFAGARAALAGDDHDAARAAVASAETVAATKLPDGDRRDRLLYACDRVERLLEAGDEPTEVAAEYLAAAERYVADDGA